MAVLGLMRGDDSLGEVLQTVLEDDGHQVLALSLDPAHVPAISTFSLSAVVMEGYPPAAVVANIRALRALPETRDTPIVVMTTSALEDLLERDDLKREVHELPMPFDICQLTSAIQRILTEER